MQLPEGLGAYGLRLTGSALPPERLVAVPSDAPVLRLSMRGGTEPERAARVDGDVADLPMLGGGRLVVDRRVGTAAFTTPQPLDPEDLAHPYLAPAAAAIQLWRGREALHGGAFAVDGRAVVVLGGREGGKSSTLAWLAAECGTTVLADDLVIVEEGGVWPGPRCLDLRPQTSAHFADRWQGALVRSGERVRLALGPAEDCLPVVAVVALEWGAEGRTELRAGERLTRLTDQRMFQVLQGDPDAVLGLAALPFTVLRRPRELQTLASTAAQLLSLAGAR
ncbi:MAG TPA: hypothetical protein VNA30_00850 [Mycobacteriales bacterium]|nr:hypothetical protein [Mycobacteriales bacterium]